MSTNMQLSLGEYDRLIEEGAFDGPRRRRVELIHGELREMSPIGPIHEDVVDLLSRWSFRNIKDDEVRVRIQHSIGLPELASAPEPDVGWVKAQSYREGRPRGEDVRLVIEVSDSSLAYDRKAKASLYAQAGVRDYWVVNIPHCRVEVYREPAGNTFQEITNYGPAETVSPLAFPHITLPVRDLFQS